MNEIASSNRALKDSCVSCILYTKLALAGDMESVALLDELLKRCNIIKWDDKGFIADSENMRGSAPVLPFDTTDLPIWRAIVHLLIEKFAERDETIAMMSGSLNNASETLKKDTAYNREQAKFTSELFDYIHKLIAVGSAMRDQLELLGADTSVYAFPERPNPPQN